ncbi:MAG: ATP-binding cassette domain-containing protein [Burkholderiales bacterium]|jgi:tungstate transport system ATP-binding protein
MADLFALQQACVKLAGRPVLHDLELTVVRQPVTTVLGANGAGKSVLLRALHGLLPLAQGRLSWPRSLRQAMVFQRPALLRRSVRGNLVWALQGAPASQTQIEQVLSRVGLSEQADRPARLLSAGEQQRLALARAWLLQPELLFLDEPCASVDPASLARIEQCLRDMTREGITLIMATHLLGQARRLSDQVIFLHEGQVTEVTPAAVFFNQPRSPEAQAFLQQALP